MTFEALVRHERFVSQLLTTAVGQLGLDRPDAVRREDGSVSTIQTATVLREAHVKAVEANHATMVTSLAAPFVGLEGESATPVKPDFAIVAPRLGRDGLGSWLIIGDAKDYERVRSRIDDQRMLKGFLQVALGVESAVNWSELPDGMEVHGYGVLAVPRNSFLQPTAVVELLDDYREEVRVRVGERTELLGRLGTTPVPEEELAGYVAGLAPDFDPGRCVSCALFNRCRCEVRASDDPLGVLVEIGVQPEFRAQVAPMVTGGPRPDRVPPALAANVEATLTGCSVRSQQRRVDPAGLAGSIGVVLAKSDAAALGLHGVGIRRCTGDGAEADWIFEIFDDPQSPATRLGVMELLGAEIQGEFEGGGGGPVHLVIPDSVTGDVLVSIADSLAGVETSRLRWERDVEVGREALTFNGDPARIPEPLTDLQRLAVSFLLEEDRARAMTLRWPLVNLRTVLADLCIPGGPGVDHGRLDYLLEWAEADGPLEHRHVSDTIADLANTPGARLANARSDAIHNARVKAPDTYRSLVGDELNYKAATVDRALAVLDSFEESRIRGVYRELERSSQEVWRRRLRLHASDMVRFGRTNWVWRNNQVGILDADKKCADQLSLLANPLAALEMAVDAGAREVALATVVDDAPLRLNVDSRRLGAGDTIVALHVAGRPCIEDPGVKVKIQAGSFKFIGLLGGELSADSADDPTAPLLWSAGNLAGLEIGSKLVVADHDWLGGLQNKSQIKVDRPKPDNHSAPTATCYPDSYENDPEQHQWCCRSHEVAEADFADVLAERRSRGELNPEVWPPVVDTDQFDTTAAQDPTDTEVPAEQSSPPEHLTLDDLE